MNEIMTLRQRLMLAYMDGTISILTVLYIIKIWKLNLLNDVCKN
jgi:hypothetical protein